MVDFEKAKADAAEAERQANLEREIKNWQEGYVQERARNDDESDENEEELPPVDASTPEGKEEIKRRRKEKAKKDSKKSEEAAKNTKIRTTNALNQALNEQVLRDSASESTIINGETYYKVGGRWLDTKGCDQTESMP